MKYSFKDVGRKNEKGFLVNDKKITIYDSDSLAVLQYNVILALLSEYIEKDKGIQSFIKDNLANVDDDDRKNLNTKYKKEFKYGIDSLSEYVALHALVYMFNQLEYKDDAMSRYKDIVGEPNKKLEYVYERIFDGYID